MSIRNSFTGHVFGSGRTSPGLSRWVPFVMVLLLSACGGSELTTWHKKALTSEFTADSASETKTFGDYLKLEDQLFAQLDDQVYAATGTGPEFALMRYSKGSKSDPGQHQPNWNRSFELTTENPVGGVLLLHGMSDSPYSLRALGETLHQRGFQVLGLRLPGHGTAPSGLTSVAWQDMAAAADLAMDHLVDQVGDKPIHLIGYSTGAALALDYSLKAEAGTRSPQAASMVLLSPAVGISPAAALAKWKRRLGLVPGLEVLEWLGIEPEFDPYKYNSFATNAAEQVYELTNSVSTRITARAKQGQLTLPPILILKSTVDATVSTNAVVDKLLLHLHPNRHEMVLFDINRFAGMSSLLVEDPAPLTSRLIADHQLPFGLTLVTNTTETTREVTAFYKKPFTAGVARSQPLGQEWPQGLFSLSHVAMPFPPDDPLYGSTPPADRSTLFLGQQALQGERGVLKIPDNFMLRLRHNPFYGYQQQRAVEWIEFEAATEG